MNMRPISDIEKHYIKIALKYMNEDDKKRYMGQLDSLQVIYKCPCGEPDCHTVHFQHFEKGKSVAIAHILLDNGRDLMLFVHEDTDTISELELV